MKRNIFQKDHRSSEKNMSQVRQNVFRKDHPSPEKDISETKRNLFSKSVAIKREKAARRAVCRLWHVVFIIMGTGICVFRYSIEISPQKIEYGYSRTIYPYIAALVSFPGRWMPAPYSASELFICLVFLAGAIWFCHYFYVLIRKKKSILTFLFSVTIHTIAIGAGIYFFYLTNWGLNYLREPFCRSLVQDSPSTLRTSDYEDMATNMVFLVNTLCQTDRYPFDGTKDLQDMDVEIGNTVRKIIGPAFVFRIHSSLPPTKSLFLNESLNALGISGIFSPLFMEPHINSDLLPWERPFVIAHEKAHSMGFASETDANFIAYLVCLGSASDMLRYSAALSILVHLRHHVPPENWQKLFEETLSPVAQRDIRAQKDRIQRNREQYALMSRVGEKVNDTYLKMNSQKLGINAYQAALPFMVVWWKDRQMTLF